MPKKIQLLTILATLLTVLFLVPYLALAAAPFEPPDIGAGIATALNLFFGPGAEDYTSEPILILQYLIFPFIALWVVLYGILTNLRLFGYRTGFNALLSFLIAVVAGPTGGLVLLVRTVFTWMGWWGFAAFAGLFFFGLACWVIGDVIRFGRPVSRYFREAGRLEDEIYDLRRQIDEARAAGASTTALRNKLEQKIREWERSKKKITEEHRFGT